MPKPSKRTIDNNGYMLIRDNPISKVGVYPYMGHELPGAPDPDKIYYVYRPAEELQDPETIKSFELLPFIDEHEVLGKDATPAEQKGVSGVIGEKVYFDYPYLRGNLRIYSNAMNNLIDKKLKIELSPGYRAKYDWTPGTFDDVQYDVVQRKIRANHLALVEEGRTGKDVSVQDSAIITFDTAEFITMDLQAILQAIAAMSEEEKMQLMQALQPTEDEPGEMTPEQEAEAAKAAEALGGAAEMAETGEAAAAEAASTGDPDKAAEAAEAGMAAAATAQEGAEEVTDKATIDALDKQIKALQKQLATMDSGHVMRAISQRDHLARRVSDYTGTFDHSAMTVDAVAQYGVKKLGIKCTKGHEAIALDAWMQGRKPEREETTSIAMDSRPNNSVKGKLWSEAQ